MNNMLAGVITSTLSSWGIKIRQLVMEEYGSLQKKIVDPPMGLVLSYFLPVVPG